MGDGNTRLPGPALLILSSFFNKQKVFLRCGPDVSGGSSEFYDFRNFLITWCIIKALNSAHIRYKVNQTVKDHLRRQLMYTHPGRSVLSKIGFAALFMGLFVLVPGSVLGQAAEDKKSENTASKTDTKAAKSAPTPAAMAKKALSEKEDPTQIGKRKINAGSDKFFGWLGGSQAKEIAVGRQL